MSDVQTWSTTAASNNSAAPNGFPEGMPPSGVNDAAREVMAAVARYREDTDGVNTSSGTDTITLSSSRTMTAYAQGDMYTFKAGGTNTGATTLNVDGLGAKDVQFNGAACTGGEIITDLMYTVVYDGTQFQLMNAASYPAIDIETLEVTNIKAKDGTASATIANSTGVMTIASSVLTTTDINGGTIDNATIATSDITVGAGKTLDVSAGALTLANDQISGDKVEGGTIAATTITTLTSTTGNITTVNATTVDTTNIEVTNLKAKDGTASATIADSTGKATFTNLLTVDVSAQGSGYPGIEIKSGPDDSAGIRLNYDGVAHASFHSWGSLDGTYLGTQTSTKLKLMTNSTEKVVIDEVGGVGIGTTAPATLLDIAASNNGLTSDTANNTVRFTDTDTTTIANQPIGKIEFYTSDSGNAGVAGHILATARGNAGGGNIIFGAAPNGGSPSNIFQVTNLGAFILNSAATIGYTIGAGAAVTQTTSRTTGVTIDAPCGAITLVSAAGSTTIQSFTVTNSVVSSTDTIIVNQKSGTDLYRIYVTAVGTGSFRISYATLSGTTTEQPVFNFCVIAGRAS